MPPLVIAATVAAAAQTATSVYGAKKQGAASDKATAFAREQAQNAYANDEVARHANYDQWATQEARRNAVRKAMGWGVQPTPAYAPGVNPRYTPESIGDTLARLEAGRLQAGQQRPTGAAGHTRPPMPDPYRVGSVGSYL